MAPWLPRFCACTTRPFSLLHSGASTPSGCWPRCLISSFSSRSTALLGRKVPFFQRRNVSMSWIFIGVVTLVTAYLTGGIGFAVLGSKPLAASVTSSIITDNPALTFASPAFPSNANMRPLRSRYFSLLAPDGAAGAPCRLWRLRLLFFWSRYSRLKISSMIPSNPPRMPSGRA